LLPKPPKATEIIYTDPEALPVMLIQTGDSYVAEYGSFNRYTAPTLAVGDLQNPGQESVIYTAAADEHFYWFYATESYVCWFVKLEDADETRHQLRCYARATGELRSIDAAELRGEEDRRQMTFAGTYEDYIYWTAIDYDAKVTRIMRCHMPTNATVCVASEDFLPGGDGGTNLHHMKIKDNYLIYALQGAEGARGAVLVVLDLAQDGAELLCAELPAIDKGRNSSGAPMQPAWIYGMDYDPVTQSFALYYHSGARDGVGYYRVGDERVTEFYTPSSQGYLYADRIELDANANTIYYNVYTMVSGSVIDHYEGVAYNYTAHRAKQLPRCFWLMPGGQLGFGDGKNGPDKVVWTVFGD